MAHILPNRMKQIGLGIPVVWTFVSIFSFFVSALVLGMLSEDGTIPFDVPISFLLGMYIPCVSVLCLVHYVERRIPQKPPLNIWMLASLGGPAFVAALLWLNALAGKVPMIDVVKDMMLGIVGYILMQIVYFLLPKSSTEGVIA